jgi:choline dehydrogenase
LRLKSKDPLERPDIQFRYFDEGVGGDDDLDAMVQGVRFVRNVADALDHLVDEEEKPGRHLYTQEQLREYVRENAWGHHACGTCAMKPLSDGGVVDSQFRVHGLRNLRVVDASIFPRIPGYLIVTSIYMIAEKAADVILSPRVIGAQQRSSILPRGR